MSSKGLRTRRGQRLRQPDNGIPAERRVVPGRVAVPEETFPRISREQVEALLLPGQNAHRGRVEEGRQ